ncbi:MAG: ABC-F family ATP-binding cassette domain-containing protein [Candidatus Dojkabacteria bacterium]|nr:ABC-F family ATP-binding cassette domain-containing protein [Candidatus Dojkabacteria bacterium]
MSIKNKTLLQFHNLILGYDGQQILSQVSGSIMHDDRIGLIGINGCGKSSLLKILAGILKPDDGQLTTACKIEYVPQLDFDLFRRHSHLYEFIGGKLEEWWLVLAEYEKLFKTSLDENRLLDTLSGGEAVKLNIATALSKDPDILLLDEPTNHLDLSSLAELEKVLQNLDIPFVIVSHNIEFLNAVVNTIWEIEKGKLTVYGGDYDFYKTEKDKLIEAQREQHEVTRKKLAKEKRALHRTTVRYQKKEAKLRRMGKEDDRSLPKIVRNSVKRKIQTNFGGTKVQKEKSIEELADKLISLKADRRKLVHLELNSQEKQGLLFSCSNSELTLPNGKTLLRDFDIDVHHSDRIAILGDNGSGKTTLVKQLSFKKKNSLLSNINYGNEYKTLFVDQKYDLVDLRISIFENIIRNNPNIGYEDTRKVLGNLNFPSDLDVTKKAKILSGGETARLAFAMATSSDIDLLVLDEPTNNLDIETVEVIADAIKEFTGTLVVISHDLNYLKQISITKFLDINRNRIVPAINLLSTDN